MLWSTRGRAVFVGLLADFRVRKKVSASRTYRALTLTKRRHTFFSGRKMASCRPFRNRLLVLAATSSDKTGINRSRFISATRAVLVVAVCVLLSALPHHGHKKHHSLRTDSCKVGRALEPKLQPAHHPTGTPCALWCIERGYALARPYLVPVRWNSSFDPCRMILPKLVAVVADTV